MNIKHIFFGALLAGLSSGAGAAISLTDDAYEPNDSMLTAYDHSGGELLTINGVALNEDWYMIAVTPDFNRVQIDLRHLDAEADLDLKLYDSAGAQLAFSTSITDNEFIEFDVPAIGGTFYIRVYTSGTPTGATYTLWWDDIAPPIADDIYEENDSLLTAADISWNEKTVLNGVALDRDYYEIFVTSGFNRVQVDLQFSNLDDNLELYLMDAFGNDLAWSISTTDNEYIQFDVDPAGGVYYILVESAGVANGAAYTLWWDDVPVPVAADSGSFGLISLLFLPLLTVLRRKVRA